MSASSKAVKTAKTAGFAAKTTGRAVLLPARTEEELKVDRPYGQPVHCCPMLDTDIY